MQKHIHIHIHITAQVYFHTSFVDHTRSLVFNADDFDKFQSFCPVHKLEFVPGSRPDDDLSAPEVCVYIYIYIYSMYVCVCVCVTEGERES